MPAPRVDRSAAGGACSVSSSVAASAASCATGIARSMSGRARAPRTVRAPRSGRRVRGDPPPSVVRLAEHLRWADDDGDVIAQRAGDQRITDRPRRERPEQDLPLQPGSADVRRPRRPPGAARASSAVGAVARRSFESDNQRSMVIAGERGEHCFTLHHADTSAEAADRARQSESASSAGSAPARAAPITTHAPRKTSSST